MKKCLHLIPLCFLLILTSCTTVSYVGQSYSSTDVVEVFYDETKIGRDYEVIGQAIGDGRTVEKVMDKLLERAKLEGADAILIKGIGKEHFAVGDQGAVATTEQISASFLKY